MPTVRLNNFKAIASAEFAPGPLTVLCGPNSSGKSSLLQALLFCVQSFGEASTVINGDLVMLGKPKDVVRMGTGEVSIEFAQTVVEADAEKNPTPIEYAMRISFIPQEDLLIPGELVIWKQREESEPGKEPKTDRLRGMQAHRDVVCCILGCEGVVGLGHSGSQEAIGHAKNRGVPHCSVQRPSEVLDGLRRLLA